MYSIPKYKAREVSVKTKAEAINDKLSTQNTRWESMRSKQKNQRPKSIKKYSPYKSIKYSSFKVKMSEVRNTKREL